MIKEARLNFFNIRLWDSDDLIRAILKTMITYPVFF